MKYCGRALGMDVEIDLEPGIYVFDAVSGEGKSYLCKCLKTLRELGEPVDGYTYSDTVRNPSLSAYLSEERLGEVKCLMFDRYDLYRDKFHKEIEELKSRCVVLVNCNYLFPFEDFEICCINFQKGSLKVFK